MKQTEIAKRLGVERTTVSKYLKRALDQGIVTITVAVKQAMGRTSLQLLRRIVANKQVIGLAWGTSICELTRHTLCYELARAFGGRCHYIYAPVITRTAEIRNAIVQDANYEKISDFWKKLGACKGQAINVLITDKQTAKIMLNE